MIYKRTPKRTLPHVAEDNVGRLRSICRLVLGRELSAVTCREVGPDLWHAFQKASLEKAGRKFDFATRYRENIGINSAVRGARCLFLPGLVRAYRSEGLDVRPDAREAQTLPQPYVAPSDVDDDALLAAWAALEAADIRMWLVIGLARFAGLRKEEIAALRVGWLETESGVIRVALRDRPEDAWWTKTGRPYRAEVIEPVLAAHLQALLDFDAPDKLVVPDPPGGEERAHWFTYSPQIWLREHGVKSAGKPLHRLRGLYADHVARITKDAVTARLAALRAAQKALGHTNPETTKNHYLSPD